MSWMELVEPLRSDKLSGAAELARRAADAVAQWLDASEALDDAAWRAELQAMGQALIAAQPAMAPLFNLVNAVLLATESAPTSQDARRRARQAVRGFRDELARAHAELVAAALPVLAGASEVLTYSYSSTVLEALLTARAHRQSLTVCCTEGRPVYEGRRLARQLAEAGIHVRFGIDAALTTFAAQASLALVGADSVTQAGVINKVGTTALALAARAADKPCYVICGRQKFFPAAAPAPEFHTPKPSAEVWPEPPMGVEVWNGYFECTPAALFSGFITEGGVLTPRTLAQTLAGLPVAAALRRQPAADLRQRR
jgi:translation initiation factor eIF-2B subunit delta